MKARLFLVVCAFFTIVRGVAGQEEPRPEKRLRLGVLEYLAVRQNADGSLGKDSDGEFGQVGLTGLALLSFLDAGICHTSRQTFQNGGKVHIYGVVVKDSLRFLIKNQDANGFFSASSIKDHAVATAALITAQGMTGSGLFLDPAAKGVQFILGSKRNEDGGWGVKKGDPTDRAATKWVLYALELAIASRNGRIAAGDDIRRVFATGKVALANMPNPDDPAAKAEKPVSSVQDEVDALIL
jgi:hypothetical protein